MRLCCRERRPLYRLWLPFAACAPATDVATTRTASASGDGAESGPSPQWRFALLDNGQLSLIDAPRLTFGNIGVYHMHMFHTLATGAHCALGPYYRTAIAARRASGEQYSGRWLNIGAPEQLYALDAMLSGVPHNRAGGVA